LRESFFWRGKLKLPARALSALIIAFIVCTFVPAAGLYAQDGEASAETTEELTPEELAAARIKAREQQENIPGGSSGTTTGTPAPRSTTWNIVVVLLTLALVAAAIYGMVFFIKKASKGKTARDPFLKILASAPLGVNKNAFVVSVGPQAWLVGTAENGVNLIGEIGDKDILNAMLLEDSKRIEAGEEGPGGRAPDFKSILRKLGIKFETDGPDGPQRGPDGIRKRRERLKGL
jgi:flagellar biogenesis protein FliO